MPPVSANLETIARFLLRHEEFTISDLADRLGVPQASVYEVTRWLRYHRALFLGEGRWVTDVPRLLDLLAATRLRDVVPARTLSTRLDLAGLHKALTAADIPYAFGYLTAANLHLYYQPEPRVFMFVQRGQATSARRLLPDGERPLQLFERDLTRPEPATASNGLRMTDLFETAVDVRAHPDGGPHANLLQQTFETQYREVHRG